MFGVPSRSRLLTTVILVVACVLLVAGVSAGRLGLFSAPKSIQTVQPRISNRTRTVRISSVRRDISGDVELTFLNESTKTIYAYTLITNQQGVKKGFTAYATAEPIGPGKSQVERIPASNLESGSGTSEGTGEIVFSAVYLEGGVTEGDAGETDKLKRTMTGIKEQAKLALKVLRDAYDSPESNSGRLLAQVESQASSISDREQSALSPAEQENVKAMVKDRLLRSIKKLQLKKATPGFDSKTQIAELLTYYQRLAEKL